MSLNHGFIFRRSVRKRTVDFRLLHGQPRAEDAARAHGTAHEECHGGGRVLGIAPESAQSQLHGTAKSFATRNHRKTVYRPQRHSIVLHQRRHRSEHKAVGIAQAVLHHVQFGLL